jgi:putative ABC transport system permease protein
MRLRDIIGIAFGNLTGNKLRTLLTILGIGLGIATIVFLVSLGYGLQQLSLSQLASLEAVNAISVSAGRGAAPDQAFIDLYLKDSRVEKVVVVNSLSMQVTLGDKKLDGVASVVPKDFFGLEGLKIASGTSYAADTTKGAVVSTALLKGMGLQPADIIGKEMIETLFVADINSGTTKSIQSTVKVYGVFTDDHSISTYLSPDLLKLTGVLPITQVKIKVHDRTIIPTFKTELEGKGYTVNAIADTISQLNTIFKVVQGVLALFGAVGLLVASIGMFNTMTITLLERTREVGIMKAIGVEDRTVYLLFLIEAVLISSLGGLSGLGIGWLSGKIINIAINLLAHSLGGESVQLFSTPLPFIAIMLSFSMLVGLLTGVMPARRGAKINPLDALRYE